MKNNYDVYLCRGFQNLVGKSADILLFSSMYGDLIKNSGDCWAFYYDDKTRIITEVEKLKPGKKSYLRSDNESCLVFGGPFRSVQSMLSVDRKKILEEKILVAYDENVARREAEKANCLDFGWLIRIFLAAVVVPLVIVSWFATY